MQDTVTGTMVKAQDSANDTEGVAAEGKGKDSREGKRNRGRGRSVAARDTKENVSEQECVKDFVATARKLWELQRLLNNRKGSLSSTYKMNTEANTRVYDLHQKTMQAPGRLGGGIRDF